METQLELCSCVWPGNSKHDISDLVGTMIGYLCLVGEIIYAIKSKPWSAAAQAGQTCIHACCVRWTLSTDQRVDVNVNDTSLSRVCRGLNMVLLETTHTVHWTTTMVMENFPRSTKKKGKTSANHKIKKPTTMIYGLKGATFYHNF